ncbi:D-methionine transport system ATP-binding protein [Georgenia satyanarayanai]|uniref:D-methionine transport system ATP-binding protein n=1 Tax=Georgenia satyanarayanai TaxID=860221 RepID=A0A2Y9AL11_9MICO|nr:ATP-binding cassette domain-containing protein [Georgenia satyanarayanai]PYF99026.1 D-methionine transport system ATP-binding protein [Georgenia satyanarayanai]SSA43988.1 D-methionine transport system ATP-binding protein [Georgenia satyanarayanai]
MISLTGLRKVYPGRGGQQVVALDGIDLDVPRGGVHGIVGESGAGKSTLIRCLTALEQPTSGTVAIDGVALSGLGERELRRQRRRIGMVFQHVNLLDGRTAAQNVAYPLRVAGASRGERAERVRELLDLVGLAGRGDAYPSQLSGGQKQRVGIARALAAEPAVLLCDEPTSALDSDTTRQILGLIRDVRDRLGLTVLIITHEMGVVREVCDSVTLLDRGRVAQSGSIAEVAGDHGSRLARALVSLPPEPAAAGRVTLEVSFAGEVPTGRVLAAVAAVEDVDVSSGTIETLAGRRVGRLRVVVPSATAADAAARLRAVGVHVEEVA